MGSFNICVLRLGVWSIFLLLAVECRYAVGSPDNQTSPTDGGANETAVATVHPTFSTSVAPSGHTEALPAEPQGLHATVNSTVPPSTNQTLFPASSKDILTPPPPTAPGERPHTGASSNNATRNTPAPGERSNTGASSANGTRPTVTPATTPAVRPITGSSPTNGTIATVTPPTNGTRASVPPGEHSTPPASSTNGTRRNATRSVIPGGTTTTTRTASSVPVTRQPCPTPSSTNGTAPPQPGVSTCASSPSGVVSQCLVAIGLLAAVLTVFFVCTMVLCTKLSSRKYSLGGQRGTEMVCLSTMMTSHNGTGSRRAHLEGRRTLLTGPEDSDDDGGDNLTLNSFLPEGDRMV
ncbi:P-selectin glycoprotein ligand 1 [Gadus macrocephalus]|uniref:P-selectin glycoprotein ligand 1 n=1 Tax=Gadus macrocephalus TaxID=80720 RepID=UPI0028CB761D|nr:P-selectin glycoprotein ligand 1 [Gadus macrocephalus]XP_059906168.1 P-selectin glycoprotein ligand 1 [Gadus macrocephalus]